MSTIEFTDRYQAAGIPYPDVSTMCEGQCDGMGCYPQFVAVGNTEGRLIHDDQPTEAELAAWHEKHNAEPHECDGWHFIKCPDCGGTGKRKEAA